MVVGAKSDMRQSAYLFIYRRGMSEQYVVYGGVGPESVEVYVAVDAVDVAVFGKLPYVVVLAVERGALAAVACHKEYLVVKVGREKIFVEFVAAIEYGRDAVVVFGEVHKFGYAVALLLGGPFAHLVFLYVDHWDEVLTILVYGFCEVVELCMHACLGGEQVVGSHFEAELACSGGVVDKLLVGVAVALGGFDIYKLYVGVFCHGLPIDVAIVVRHVDAVVEFSLGGAVGAGDSIVYAVEYVGEKEVYYEPKQHGGKQTDAQRPDDFHDDV